MLPPFFNHQSKTDTQEASSTEFFFNCFYRTHFLWKQRPINVPNIPASMIYRDSNKMHVSVEVSIKYEADDRGLLFSMTFCFILKKY